MRPIFWLYVFAPVALALELLDASPSLGLLSSAVGAGRAGGRSGAVGPAAAMMGEATEELATRSGPGVGGLVNVTFGNAPELIIAVFALADGLQEVVKASLVGSIVGNALLVLGAAMRAGARRRPRQRFDRPAAQTQAGMLMLTVIALVLPSLLLLARHDSLPTVSARRGHF